VTLVIDNENATAAMDKIMKIMYVTRKGIHKKIIENITPMGNPKMVYK
jgi:hypothetical protein